LRHRVYNQDSKKIFVVALNRSEKVFFTCEPPVDPISEGVTIVTYSVC